MKWNIKAIIIILFGGLAAAFVLVGIEYLLRQIGLINKLPYSLAKAVVITIGIVLFMKYSKNSQAGRKIWNVPMMFRVILSVILITAIDMLIF